MIIINCIYNTKFIIKSTYYVKIFDLVLALKIKVQSYLLQNKYKGLLVILEKSERLLVLKYYFTL